MTSSNGPYYMSTTRIEDIINPTDPAECPNVYPDPGLSMTSSAHMYALAAEALQYREASATTQLANLIQAATAAAGEVGGIFLGKSQRKTRSHSGERNGIDDDESAMESTVHASSQRPTGQVCNGQAAVSQGSCKRKLSRNSRDLKDLISDDASPREVGTRLVPKPRASVSGVTEPEAPIAVRRSANAIHREPSASSKRYTRPPMSKLYKSLQVTHEVFLQLQAAAKEYMLIAHIPSAETALASGVRVTQN